MDRNDSSGYPETGDHQRASMHRLRNLRGAHVLDAIDLKGGYNGEQVFGVVKGA
jgi:hypothetical protein